MSNPMTQTPANTGTMMVKGVVALIAALLLFAPFLFQDTRAIEVAARICIFIVLVASFDLLIGYTGIVSFAHTMFFGFGAYGAAILLKQMGPGWTPVILGALAGVAVSLVFAVVIGLLSLRVKAIFFAMITLAAASVVLVLASQDDIVDKPLSFHDNGVDLPQGPGLGVTLNEDKLAEYSRKDQ